MIEFREQPHRVRPDITVIEIWKDNRLVAMLSPNENGRGVRLFSKHITALGHSGTPDDAGVLVVAVEFDGSQEPTAKPN